MSRLTAEHVQWAFRLFLDRDIPIDMAEMAPPHVTMTTRSLREYMMSSMEFLINNKFYLMQRLIPDSKTVIFPDGPGGYRIMVDLSDLYVSWGIVLGSFEAPETKFVQRVVKPGGRFVDVGANVGYFTLLARSLVGDSGEIHAFEPRLKVFDMLAQSVRENGLTNIHVHRLALGAQPGKLSLCFPAAEFNLGASRLASEGQAVGNGDLEETVEVARLDDVLSESDRVDFIKLDIEGAEGLFLVGAERVLRQQRPTIMSEINPFHLRAVSHMSPGEYIERVCALGYELDGLHDDGSTSPTTVGALEEIAAERDVSTAIFLPK